VVAITVKKKYGLLSAFPNEEGGHFMKLSLRDLRRVAIDVAHDENPMVRVLAAMNNEGAADYAEVTFALPEKAARPSRVVIGLSREASEPQIRQLLHQRLKACCAD
jgi:hypothetical protein